MLNQQEKTRLKTLFARARNLLNNLKCECDYIDKNLKEIEEEWKLNNR